MTHPHRSSYDSVLDLIGWTPLVRLNRVTAGLRTPVYGKCDFMNPGGSLKDRIGLAMIEEAEADGRLRPGGVIVEATGGNTGLALAMAASIKGYRCIFTMPDKMSHEKTKLLRAFGAEVVITPTAVGPEDPDHYLVRAKQIAADTPGALFTNQFYNQANPLAHYRTTGPELWEQSEGRITHFLTGSGTGGTITGTGRYLKERNPEVRIIGVDPVGSVIGPFFNTGAMPEGHPYKVEGLGNDKIPATLDLDVVDEYRTVSDAQAFRMARRISTEEGLFVGGSSGLITSAALDVAREIDDPQAFVVTMLCDWGERYLTKLYDEEWMRANGFLERPMRSVQDLLTGKPGELPALLTVEPGQSVRTALAAITEHGVSQLPVIDGDQAVGSVLESELMARVLQDPSVLDQTVESVMQEPFPVVDGHASVEDVRALLSRRSPAVLVRSNGSIDAILTRYDLVRGLTGSG